MSGYYRLFIFYPPINLMVSNNRYAVVLRDDVGVFGIPFEKVDQLDIVLVNAKKRGIVVDAVYRDDIEAEKKMAERLQEIRSY